MIFITNQNFNKRCKKKIFAAQKQQKDMCRKDVIKQPDNFVDANLNYEEFALMNAWSISNLRNGENNTTAWDLLVKIEKDNKHYIYRKARAYRGICASDVGLGHRSRAMLGFTERVSPDDSIVDLKNKDSVILKDNEGNIENTQVIIKPACWFWYCWFHCESHLRWSFRIASIAAVITLLSFIISIISLCISIIK